MKLKSYYTFQASFPQGNIPETTTIPLLSSEHHSLITNFDADKIKSKTFWTTLANVFDLTGGLAVDAIGSAELKLYEDQTVIKHQAIKGIRPKSIDFCDLDFSNTNPTVIEVVWTFDSCTENSEI